MEKWSVIIVLAIFGMQLVKSCTLTYDGKPLTGPDLKLVIINNVPDTMKATEVLREYVTEGVKGIKTITEEVVIAATFESNKLSFKLVEDFADFELNVTDLQLSHSLLVECDDKDYTMSLQLVLTDSDNHKPKFNKENYKFTLPMPWPASISIPKLFGDEEIWVADADTSSSLTFTSSDDTAGKFDITLTAIQDQFLPDGSRYYKPYYTLDFKPKEALDEPSLSFTITVMDSLHPSTSTVTTTITIDRNSQTSMPKSPTFEHPWYLIEMNDAIKVDEELIPKNGRVKLDNSDDINAVQLTTEGDSGFISHFNIQRENNEVIIKLKTKFSEPEPQLGLITLKAMIERAAQPGYSVLNIVFPPPECPATTTAEPCTTPEITTSTTDTTASSTTGISTTTDGNFSPTSTEDPCSRCPTITTECPSETTISEPTSTSTSNPVSKTTPEMKTTTEDPCSSCPTTINDCPTVTITEATSCPVCNESTPTSTENIWTTDISSRTSEATSCSPCDCSSTVHSSESSSATTSCPSCETCTTPEVTTCPTCDCSSTAADFSSTTYCPTCEPCPSQEPPAECKLHFPKEEYNWKLHVGDSGAIGIIEAYSEPPMEPWNIHYLILDDDNDIRHDFKITDGKMYTNNTLNAGNYKFIVFALANCFEDGLDGPNATVNLNVYTIDVCGNESDIEILFPEGVKIISVYENSKDPELTSPLVIPPSLDCTFSLEEEPSMAEFQIDASNGQISMDPIDREATIFHGASIPEIKLTLTATCSIKKTFNWINRNIEKDSSTSRAISMTIFVNVLDKNDNAPEFASENITLGYPTKSIAEEEMPTHLGIAEAYDADIGENAEIIYDAASSKVIIEKISGYYYPHPNNFQYEDFDFQITARNVHYSTPLRYCAVKVKILSQKYLTEIRIKGEQVANAQEIVKKISNITGLDVGIVTARLVKSSSSEDSENALFDMGIFGKPSYVFTDGLKEMPVDGLRLDDTYSLRLVVYAFKDGTAVDTNTFQDQLNESGSKLMARGYAPAEQMEATDQSSAVIGLSVVLALLILSVIGFVVYRFWMKRRNRDNDSLERGLVNERNEAIRDDNDFIYKSEKSSISSGDTEMADQGQDPDDMNSERRKSVAFAEEAQVIPGDDEESQGNITGSIIDVKM